MGEFSCLALSRSGSPALRTVVPIGVVSQLGLAAGDRLEWILKADGGKLGIEVVVHKK